MSEHYGIAPIDLSELKTISLAARGGKVKQADFARVYSRGSGIRGLLDSLPHILAGDYAPKSAVEIFTKDLGIVTDIGRGLKFPTPVAAMALQMFVMTAAAGMGRDDDASVARMLAGLAGLELPRPKG